MIEIFKIIVVIMNNQINYWDNIMYLFTFIYKRQKFQKFIIKHYLNIV